MTLLPITRASFTGPDVQPGPGESGLVVTLVEWDQIEEVQRLQKRSGLHTEIVKMFSNDPRLADLANFQPDAVEFKRTSDAELSRRVGAGRRRRRRR